MEHNIYSKKGLQKPSFFQKVLGTKIKENAIIELNNLLAEKDLTEITIDEVHGIAEKYGVNFQQDYNNEVTDLYKSYLNSCLEDKFISEEELADLKQLKLILNINDKKVNEIHNELAGKIYKVAVDVAIEDGELDEDERIFIEKLQNDLKLPQETADQIYEKSGQELIQSYMNNAIADAQITPEEEEQLTAIAKNLNVELKDDASKSDLEKYKLYWQIENDDMPELHVDLNIPKSEKCYFFTEDSSWHEKSGNEEQTTGTRANLSLKIAKGLYWRDPSDNDIDLVEEKWEKQQEGKLYLTNKRILFKSDKDKVILLSRITDFSVYQNGILINKEGGGGIFLAFDKSSDIFAMLLGKAISQLR